MDEAIAILEAEVDALQKVLNRGKSREDLGSPLWYVLQAKSLGLSLLRKARLQGITQPRELDSFRAGIRRTLNAEEVSEQTDSKVAAEPAPVV